MTVGVQDVEDLPRVFVPGTVLPQLPHLLLTFDHMRDVRMGVVQWDGSRSTGN